MPISVYVYHEISLHTVVYKTIQEIKCIDSITKTKLRHQKGEGQHVIFHILWKFNITFCNCYHISRDKQQYPFYGLIKMWIFKVELVYL